VEEVSQGGLSAPTIGLIIPTLDPMKAQASKDKWADAGLDYLYMLAVDNECEGFTKTVNIGFECLALEEQDGNYYFDYFGILGDDAVPETEGWLLELRKALERGYGFAFPTMPCRTIPISRARRASPTEQLVEIPHGPYGCVLMRREVLEEVGLLDEAFSHYGSDVDHQRRSSWKSVWAAHVYVHRELHEPREPWWTEDGEEFRRRYG